MHALAARILHATLKVATRLPWPAWRALADAWSAAVLRRRGRELRVAETNLGLAYPDLLPAERTAQAQAIVRGTARQALETVRLWARPAPRNLTDIVQVHGAAHLDAAIAAGRGVIVAAPHFGNWELLNQWLATRTPIAILYAPPDSAFGDAFLQRVRASTAERVVQVRAEAAGVRQLLKWLQGGGVVGILPDQQPKQGDGEFAPFFGQAALTMTLLGRLAARTSCACLVAWCERIADTPDGPRFALHVEPLGDSVAQRDAAASATALNAAIERVARRDVAQYQWTYKRFSLQPDGTNPYWPHCY